MKHVPNLLTLLRIVLTPVFLWLTFGCRAQGALYCALIVFLAAALSDWLDGRIARKYNIISNFGKIWDPLADKMIVLAALAALTWKAPFHLPVVIFIIIAVREILVTILRDIYARRNIIMPADKLGKLKTMMQMVGIVVCLLLWAVDFTPVHIVIGSYVWFYIVALITTVSGLNYFVVKRK